VKIITPFSDAEGTLTWLWKNTWYWQYCLSLESTTAALDHIFKTV